MAITYAHRHPEKVSRLVFYGSYCGQPDDDPAESEMNDTLDQLIKVGGRAPTPRSGGSSRR